MRSEEVSLAVGREAERQASENRASVEDRVGAIMVHFLHTYVCLYGPMYQSNKYTIEN